MNVCARTDAVDGGWPAGAFHFSLDLYDPLSLEQRYLCTDRVFRYAKPRRQGLDGALVLDQMSDDPVSRSCRLF